VRTSDQLVQYLDVDSDVGAVERYLSCLAAHDWEGLAATLADQGFVRDGPFRDLVAGKEPYVAFLRAVVTSLKGHELTVQRVSHAPRRRRLLAQPAPARSRSAHCTGGR
jgi:hypothetical protein